MLDVMLCEDAVADQAAAYTTSKSYNDLHLLLYMDYETLGEHQKESSGIFTFFQDLTEIILNSTHMRFSRPSDSLSKLCEQMSRVSVQRPVSWADSGKNLSAWLS